MGDLLLCTDSQIEGFSFFDPSIAPDLLFYAYVPMAFLSLLMGLLILGAARKGSFTIPHTIFFLLSLTFSFHLFNELMQWIVVPAGMMLFGWALSLLFHALIAFFTLYFALNFGFQRPTRFSLNLIGVLLILPVIILLPTELNILGFDLDWCGAVVGPLWNYIYGLEIVTVTVLGILFLRSLIQLIKTRALVEKERALLFGATFIFTVVFFGSELLGDITYIYEINLLGPLGMFAFLATMTFMIVKYGAFNIKMIAAQALVATLLFLVGAEFFFAESRSNQVIISITLLGTLIGGYFLVRSVKKEVQQREQLEELTQKLEAANERLKELDKMKSEFVSIASHQLRSPITAIRGYVSMLTEGSYGKFPDKARETLDRIAESSKFMASSIEDYLNVSRIEAGNMKYELSDFNLKEQAERVTDELRQVALKKGLVLLFRSDVKGSGMVHADIGKTRQVIMSFVDNSIKYTQKGTVTVIAHDDPSKKKMWVTIHDTGIGMSKETLSEVFDKFVRAKNANQVNVTGTGLGLYVAKKMASGMGGKVWAESEGEGKGSSFHIEFPMLPGKVNPT